LNKQPVSRRQRKPAADTGNVDKAVEISLDIEQPICEVSTLLNAASFVKRIGDG
jgi:hypothetical protein